MTDADEVEETSAIEPAKPHITRATYTEEERAHVWDALMMAKGVAQEALEILQRQHEKDPSIPVPHINTIKSWKSKFVKERIDYIATQYGVDRMATLMQHGTRESTQIQAAKDMMDRAPSVGPPIKQVDMNVNVIKQSDLEKATAEYRAKYGPEEWYNVDDDGTDVDDSQA
jgi:hypothetical protein